MDDKLVGFAHYLFHRSTWAPKRYCYLEDLFVADSARGLAGAGADRDGLRESGSGERSRIYWLTQSSNEFGAGSVR